MKVEIRITTATGEFVVVKHQPLDKNGKPIQTQRVVLASAVADARSWLTRNAFEAEPRR